MNKKDLEMILEFVKEYKDEIREVLGIEKIYVPQPYPVYPYIPDYTQTLFPLEPWRPFYTVSSSVPG